MKYVASFTKDQINNLVKQLQQEFPDAGIELVADTQNNCINTPHPYLYLKQNILTPEEISMVRGILPTPYECACINLDNTTGAYHDKLRGKINYLALARFPDPSKVTENRANSYSSTRGASWFLQSLKKFTFDDLQYKADRTICENAFFYSKQKKIREIQMKDVQGALRGIHSAINVLYLIRDVLIPTIKNFNDSLVQFNKKIDVIQAKTEILME